MISYILTWIVTRFVWLLPLPLPPRLVKIGNPGRSSPVLVTCNWRLTVRELSYRLRREDLYLLVANSRGINVWCAAAGGHFTHHDVISIIKTSGIENLVDHRTLVLPQLAATGIDPVYIKKKIGWKAVWGPVSARDIPGFLAAGKEATDRMRRVEFGLGRRMSVALGWAAQLSIPASLVFVFVNREAILPLNVLIFGMSCALFMAFPLYERFLGRPSRGWGTIAFGFEQGGVQLVLWGLYTAGVVIPAGIIGGETVLFFFHWILAGLVVTLFLTFDLAGSTPVYKSVEHEERSFTVVLNVEICRGTGICTEVCPRGCFDLDRVRRKIVFARPDDCEQCAACIVQCPFDALSFISDRGERILPETTRTYKLNLMGKRQVRAS
ncbi:MAG: 4Fe-4S dicluster domain-containing protein [Deltaproteobacteria bacterium]|nr:4Fe-4S dicluster domain-containing protein [Candidatus Zymogenaceae bacterium]